MVAKLSDVAELAGVSPSTVSRVINKKGYLSEKTIHKVQEAMRQLSYQPNNLARSLQGKSAKLVGLIFPTISNIFFAELVGYLEAELFNRGYKTILCNSQHESDKEREYLEMLEANQVDGIISGSHNLGIKDYNRVTAPIISFDRNLSPEIPVVSSDNRAGGRLAAETLKKAGCTHPLMITGNDDSNSPTGLRKVGFQAVFPEATIVKIPSDFSAVRKEMEIKRVLEGHKPDGIFVSDDLTALLVQHLLVKNGYQIPQEVKLIGYDGTNFITDYHPDLTTIQQPLQDLAVLLVDLLMERIHGQEDLHPFYTLPVSLRSGRTI